MTTALARPSGHNLTLAETVTLAETFVRSGFFKDSRDAAQAVVKIMAGRELGFAPMASMTGIHVVDGKVTLSANLMAAAIKRSGKYNYRVVEHTADVCRIAFLENGEQVGESSFSTKDATAAGVNNKQVWKAYGRNMLFARALSNGARWYCPDVFGGPLYTPEELGAEVNGDGEVVEHVALPAPAAPPSAPPSRPAPVVVDRPAADDDAVPMHWTPLIDAAAGDLRELHSLWDRIPAETPSMYHRAGAMAKAATAFAEAATAAATAGPLSVDQRRWLGGQLADMGITLADAAWPTKARALLKAAGDVVSGALDAVEAAASAEVAA